MLRDPPEEKRYRRGSEEFARLLSFSDGVIAIAITILVLAIDLPRPAQLGGADSAMAPLVAALWPQIRAFLISFVVIAYAWMGHHRLMAQLQAIDRPMMLWNLLFLLVVVFLPLQAQLIGLYDDNAQALSLYALSFALLFLVDAAGLPLAHRRRLLTRVPTPASLRRDTLAKLIPVAVFVASIPLITLCGPDTGSWFWLLIWPLEAQLDRILADR